MKYLAWLAILLPMLTHADPATEQTSQGVKTELEAQTGILTQIEANTADGGVQQVSIRAIYIGFTSGSDPNIPPNCGEVSSVESPPFRVVIRLRERVLGEKFYSLTAGPGSGRQITVETTSLAEAEGQLLSVFNAMNGTNFTFADATDIDGVLDCLNLNEKILGIQ